MAEEGLGSLVNQVRKYVEFARRMLRRWWIVAICSVIGIGISVGMAMTMTRIYESRTLIAWKEGARIFTSSDEGGAPQENWLQQRVQQMVSSHTRLLKIANEYDLYPGERGVVPPEIILEYLRKAVKFDTVGSDTFWISFEYKDPRKAQAVAARLAKEFIDQAVGEKLGTALVTQSFMEGEVAKAKVQMDSLENELATFVSEHPEFQTDPVTGLPRGLPRATPGVVGPSYVNVRNPELRKALARKGQLQAQLQLAQNPQGDARVNQAKADLLAAQRALATKRRQYTDQHPDVQRAHAYVRQLQAQLQSALDAGKAAAVPPARILSELDELERTIARLSKPVAAVRKQEPQPKAASQPSETHLSARAQLEKRWYQLMRDREVNKAKYDQLQERLTKAKMTASLEKKKAETQFTIVDPASFPHKPLRPSRSKMVMAGTALSVLLGLAIAALLVLLDPRIYNEDDLRKACELPVLAQIPKEA
jgi:polysaccharide biosynthesis transport protein